VDDIGGLLTFTDMTMPEILAQLEVMKNEGTSAGVNVLELHGEVVGSFPGSTNEEKKENMKKIHVLLPDCIVVSPPGDPRPESLHFRFHMGKQIVYQWGRQI
jgi:hypothetical protein